MAVKIRLRRTGANNDVCYRVVAVDSRAPREGRFLESLGWYDPKREGLNFSLKTDRIEHWRSQGAQVSDTVSSLLRRLRREAAPQAAVAETVEAAPPPPPAPAPAPAPAAPAAPDASEADQPSE